MKFYQVIATGFGVGYFPFLPGTAGSLLGLFLFLPLRSLSPFFFGLFFVFLFGLGTYAAGACERSLQKKDAGEIVIDEIAAMMIVLFLLPASLGWWIAGFITFRIFDIAKPPPIPLFEKLPGGWGIMADDVAAAGYAVLSLRLIEMILKSLGVGG
ncbi:MAG: phosphatidylglycerophosphatase A [Nitrospirae bacterium]|nr:phosphatidylglycerophosphatase A [Candidatus Manganitrophaceae bacterium]